MMQKDRPALRLFHKACRSWDGVSVVTFKLTFAGVATTRDVTVDLPLNSQNLHPTSCLLPPAKQSWSCKKPHAQYLSYSSAYPIQLVEGSSIAWRGQVARLPDLLSMSTESAPSGLSFSKK